MAQELQRKRKSLDIDKPHGKKILHAKLSCDQIPHRIMGDKITENKTAHKLLFSVSVTLKLTLISDSHTVTLTHLPAGHLPPPIAIQLQTLHSALKCPCCGCDDNPKSGLQLLSTCEL